MNLGYGMFLCSNYSEVTVTARCSDIKLLTFIMGTDQLKFKLLQLLHFVIFSYFSGSVSIEDNCDISCFSFCQQMKTTDAC